jgi:hypothetical protein
MTANDKIDILALTKTQEEQQRKLDAKYKDMTHCEALDGFYWWCKQFILFLQGLSICLGMGFPLMLADRMPSVSALVFSLGFIFIVVLEAAKGWTMDEINRLRIINIPKAVKIPMKRFLFAAVVLFGLNVAIGFWSSPFIVEILVEPKGIVSIAGIDSIYTAKKEAEKVRFDSLTKKFETTALQLAIMHARKDGTIHSAGAKSQATMVNRAATQTDSLTAALSFLNREHSTKVQAAENTNAETMKEHKAFCNSFSFWAALGAGVIEFFLTILAYWIADFDHKKRTENKARLEGIEANAKGQSVKGTDIHTPLNTPPLPQKNTKGKREKVFSSANLAPTMQFKQGEPTTNSHEPKEGDILPPVGRGVHRALIEVSGKLDARTKGQLRTLKSAQGNDKSERSVFIQTLIDKLP